MKHFQPICFALLLFFSPGCKKYLDKAPLDSINSENFFQTTEDAINAVNAAYQPLQRPKLYNLRMWTSDIFAGNSVVGAGGGTDGIETVQEANFTTDPSNAGVLDLYRGPYPGILYCNLVIANVPGMDMDTPLPDIRTSTDCSTPPRRPQGIRATARSRCSHEAGRCNTDDRT